ncbi:hypothetical protein HMPREF1580_00185 [Gardnerella vaginalis JCP8070]|nr:hypothetical protein HMPREF1586_01282 [Gardnerella vaginalis JCP8522]EPI60797.1 hypothetical protein HMPREF1580_00185 [Gardnerella vaginalis JCP8070]
MYSVPSRYVVSAEAILFWIYKQLGIYLFCGVRFVGLRISPKCRRNRGRACVESVLAFHFEQALSH